MQQGRFIDKMHILIPFVFAFIFLFFSSACHSGGDCSDLNKGNCPVLTDFTVFDKNHVVHFNHLCSEVNNQREGSWQSYAFFEKPNSDTQNKALILGEVSVGWVGGPEGPKGVGLDIEKMEIKSLKSWSGDHFSVALKIKTFQTGQTVTGNVSKTFFLSEGSYPEKKEYALSEEGNLDWERFKEPESKMSDHEIREHRFSEGIFIDHRKISQLKEKHSLSVILKNERTGSFIELQGPTLENIESRLNVEKPKFRVLNFWQTMNPFQDGGLWDWFKTGYRYKDCIHLRKQAKKDFANRFAQQ